MGLTCYLFPYSVNVFIFRGLIRLRFTFLTKILHQWFVGFIYITSGAHRIQLFHV